MSRVISGHAIPHHLYTDESQLYVFFVLGDTGAALNVKQLFLAFVHSWMSTYKLKLSPDKTELFLIESKELRSKYLSMFPFDLFGVKTNQAKFAGDVGEIFDKYFTFHSHISAVCSSCFTICEVFTVTLIWMVKNYLQLPLCLLVSMIAINFCIIDTDLTKLQRVKNRLARVVTQSPPLSHSVPRLCSLIWLLVNFRIYFNQSINQSKFYSANILGEASLCGATAKSVFNSKIDQAVPQHQRAM